MNTETIKNPEVELTNMTKEDFDDLFRSLYAPLVNYAFRFTKQKASAADIVQDSFVQLWQNRQKITVEYSLKSYMYRIVRNLSLNHLRDRSYEHTGLEIADMHDMEAVSEDDEHSAYIKQKFKLLKKWIEKLPERQREAFELSRFEGLDHEEIAGVMNVSKRTVNNHIVDALKNIQKYHDEYFNNLGQNGHG